MSEILLSRSLIHLEKIMRPDADSLKNHFLHIYVHGLAEMLVCVVEMQIYATYNSIWYRLVRMPPIMLFRQPQLCAVL